MFIDTAPIKKNFKTFNKKPIKGFKNILKLGVLFYFYVNKCIYLAELVNLEFGLFLNFD